MCILDPIFASAFRKALGGRGDGDPWLKYFYGEDFGVKTASFSFRSGKWTLRGHKYFVNDGPYKGLLVFYHGLGAGHTSYSQECAYFAKVGYLVLAYDYTGCMLSEGVGINNLGQAAIDQRYFYQWLDQQKDLADMPRYSVGHSWGGYASMMSLQPAYRVKKAVSISGFFGVASMVGMVDPKLKKLAPMIRSFERRRLGKEAAIEGLELLKQVHAPFLYIQGEHDQVVKFEVHFKVLEARKDEFPNVSLYLVKNRGHQPYWTESAQQYMQYIFDGTVSAEERNQRKADIDYDKLNEDDPIVMKAIVDFLGA